MWLFAPNIDCNHGNEVKIAINGCQVGDALVNNENKIALVISMAYYCYVLK